jgi:hypothetical protein
VVKGQVVAERGDEVVRPCALIAAAEAVEDACDRIAHRHAADALRLGRAERAAGEAAPHEDHALGEVDVRPAQRAQLAHAQAGERRGDEERPEELRAVGPRDRVPLLGRQHIE